MNELVRDPAPRFVPTKFDRDPKRTAPGSAVTVWGNTRPAGDDNTPRAPFGLRGEKAIMHNMARHSMISHKLIKQNNDTWKQEIKL